MNRSPNFGEQRAVEFFAENALACEQFTEEEMRKSQTPDFRVFRDKEFILYSEAKHIQEDQWEAGLRPDPVFNRLAAHIHEAAKQLLAVNPNHEYPNVLVFTNSDHACRIADLKSVITGNESFDSGLIEPMFKHISEGRIKNDKYLIDLYVWCNEKSGSKFKFQLLFTMRSRHLPTLCSLFNVDPSKLQGGTRA